MRLKCLFVALVLLVSSLPASACNGDELLVADLHRIVKQFGAHMMNRPGHEGAVDMILADYMRGLTLLDTLPQSLKDDFKRISSPIAPTGIEMVSYIQLGGVVGDQGLALYTMAIGQLLGIWKVVTPADIAQMEGQTVSEDEIRNAAGLGALWIMTNGTYEQVFKRNVEPAPET